MSLFDDIRKVAPWTKDLSDEEIVAKGVELTGAPLKDVAATLGYQAPTSDFGKELSAGWAGYKAGMEHIGGALGSTTAKEWAAQNEVKAEVLRGLSNAPHSYEDVKFGDKDKGVLNYLGALAAGSAPYIAEQALFTIGDVATGGALTPAHAARIGEIGATIARKAAGKSAAEIAAANTAKDSLAQGITRTVVGTEVGYPSSVGQLLQNQYEESQDYNLPAAAGMALPYSMLNQVGIEGAVARGGLNVANLAKRPMRALGTGLITAAEESGGEVGQAFLENVAKKSVNADYDLTGEDAFRNLRESAVGGFALGGVTGGIGGALSRKPGSLAKGSNNEVDIGGTPDGNAVNAAIDQNSPEVTTVPVPQAPMQVTPSGDVLVTPAQQQAYQDFGQSQLGVKAQQEAAAKQQEQQIIQTVKSFGGMPNPAGGIDIAGKRLYGQEQANKFATELQQAMEGRSETDMSLASAVVRSGLANIKQTAGVKQLVNAVGKVLDTYQIGHVDTVEEAAATLNDQIGRLEGASALKEAERINSLFTALTGQSAPEFAKIQEAVAAQEAAKTTKGKKNERLQLQQQSDAGVRAVPEQGGTAEVRGTTVGNVRPTSVQSIEPGSVGAGQVSQQVRAVPSEGVPAGASANVTGPNLASVQAQGQVNEQGTSSQEGRGAQDIGQTTGSVEAETEAEKAAGTVKRIVNKILDAVVKRQGRMSNERLVKYKEFLSMYMGGINPNLHFSAEELAAQFGVSVDTIDGWNKSAKNFFEANKGVIVAQFEQAAAAEGMTTQQVYEMMTAKYEAEAKEVAALEEGQYLTEATNQEDEQAFEEKAATAADTEVSTVDKRELQAEDSGMKVVSGRTGASIQEVHKAAETVNARITKLLTEQNEAYREGDDTRGDALQEEIDRLTVEATKLNAKEVRKSEEKAPKKRKKVKDAIQESSAKKVPVRERAGSSEGVRQEDTEKREAAPESKAEEKALTPAEAAEKAWNELATKHGIPTYDTLTDAVKADWIDSVASGNAKLKDAQVIFDKNQETKTVSETKLDEKITELPKAQIQALEKHYGVDKDSAEFFDKVKEDVVNYINKGATAVAGAIRSIIKSIAEGVLAMAVVFNPSINKPADFNLPAFMQETRTITAEAPASVSMSDVAKRAYSVSAPTMMKANKPFFIADKPNGKIHLFDKEGKHIATSDALYGKTAGDRLATNVIEKKVDQLLDIDKVTPAGTYTLQVQTDPEYNGGYTLRLFDGKTSLGGIAIHSVYLGNAAEMRPARLLSKNLQDKKISFGCINTTPEFFINKVMPRLTEMNDAGVVVIPDAQETVDQYLKPTTVTETTKTASSKGVSKLEGTKEEMVAKEENIQLSKAEEVGSSTKAEVEKEVYEFLGRKNSKVLKVVQSITDLPANIQAALSDQERVGGFVTRQGVAYLVADNIATGNARAVFMHEVGSHLGLQEMLSAAEFDTLVDKVIGWSKESNTVESVIANKALERVSAAKVAKEERNTELIAYFIEEAIKAGINPTVMAGGVRPRSFKIVEWLRSVKRAFERALSKLGMGGINLNAQDMVDLAYGAAHIVMKNAPTVSRAETEVQYSVQAFDKARAQAQSTINKLPPSLRGPVRGIWSALFNVKEAGLSAMITKDVVEMAEKYMPSAANFLKAHELRTQITREHEQHLSKIKVAFDKLDEATGKKVNDIIAASTTSGEWAFDPEIKGAKINYALNKKFEALPDAAQQIIEDVFMSSRKDLKDMQAAVRESVDNAFAEKLAAATTPDEQKAVEKEKAKMLKSFSGILGINNITPYAPLKRFGSFVVVAKSQQYRDAEANGDTKEIEKLQSDENHFIVEFAETAGEAEEIYDNLAARNQYAELERPFKKSEARESLYSGTDLFKGFAKLKRVIASQKTEEAGNEVLNKLESMVNELYLLSLADSSARKAQLQRKNISGFDRDMMRAFFTQSAANAHYIANLKTSDAVLDSVVAMQKEAGKNRAGAYPFLNELMMREAQALEIREPSMLDAANRLTSDWFLTFSPSFYLQQATQTYVLSLPWLAGKYQYGKASAAITKAYQDILPIVKGIDLKEHVDLSTAPEDVRDMLKTLVGRGRIDIGVEVETAGHRSEKGNAAAATYSKVTNTLRGAINRLETINRATAAIAAYRLEMAKSGDKAKATEAADQVVHVTHGSYDGFNTPRIFGKSGFTRSIFQFRRFQVIQLSMLARMMNKAFVNGTKEEKAVARKQLAFLVSHTMALGGMKGMPFYVLGSFAYSLIKGLFGDSEDPEEFEDWLRRHGGLLLARGIPAWMGLDVSGKLGMGNVMSILPYTEVDLTSRGGIEKAALGAMGPFIGGLLPKMADGVGLVGRGDYYKGLEQMMPNGVSNAMKGIRFATEGITLRNGDVVVPPEEISFMQAIMQGLGLPTAGITERSYAQNEVRKVDKYYGDKESEIKYQYAKAYKAGNSSALAEARQEWALVQQSKREQGIKASPLSELIKAPMAQQKRERSVIGGVESKLGNRQMVRNIVEG